MSSDARRLSPPLLLLRLRGVVGVLSLEGIELTARNPLTPSSSPLPPVLSLEALSNSTTVLLPRGVVDLPRAEDLSLDLLPPPPPSS